MSDKKRVDFQKKCNQLKRQQWKEKGSSQQLQARKADIIALRSLSLIEFEKAFATINRKRGNLICYRNILEEWLKKRIQKRQRFQMCWGISSELTPYQKPGILDYCLIYFLNLLPFIQFICYGSYNKFGAIMEEQEDSFQQYKKQLEEDLGISSLPSPQKPMNTYMRFYVERSAEARSKGQIEGKQLTLQITSEWKELSPKKKEFYQQIYQIRLRQYGALFAQFKSLSNKNKVQTPYTRFIKKRYLQYSKQYKNLSATQITKLANQDWMGLPTQQKQKLNEQFQVQKNDELLNIDRSDQIKEYLQKLQRYHDVLQEDKDRPLRKYGLTKEHLSKLKSEHRQKQYQMNKILREEKLGFKRQEKKKYRELQRQKQQQEKDRIKKIKEEQRERQKQILKVERLKLRAEAEAKKIAEREIKAIKKEIEDIERKTKKPLPKDQPAPEKSEKHEEQEGQEATGKKEAKSKKIKKADPIKVQQSKKVNNGKKSQKKNVKSGVKGKKIKRNK